MPQDSNDLVRDLGEILAAMKVADDATRAAIDRAARAAGVAVSKTINRTDAFAASRARELLAESRRPLEILGVEVSRARAAAAAAKRISRRSLEVVAEMRALAKEIRRRRRRN